MCIWPRQRPADVRRFPKQFLAFLLRRDLSIYTYAYPGAPGEPVFISGSDEAFPSGSKHPQDKITEDRHEIAIEPGCGHVILRGVVRPTCVGGYIFFQR